MIARRAIPLVFVFLLIARSATAADAPLADAAEKADWKLVESLLVKKADPKASQIDGMTALHWAVWHDETKPALRLIEGGADVTATNRYGVTALSLACTNGNTTLVEQLLKAGADANTVLPGGETVLMTASRTGRVGPVKALLARSADVNAKERKGQTAIMWAAAEGHADVVSLLIDAKADFRMSLDSGFTPLFFAVREGRADVVDVLLKAGIDINAPMRPKVRSPRTPRNGTSPLILAIENGHFELATDLLQAGADPNDQRSGFTPLHTLSWVRKPNRGDGLDGNPPPIGSGRMTSLQFVKVLVEHGAKVNAQLRQGNSGRGRMNPKGATPFFFASDTADLRFMKLLLELGADPTLTNADDCPPILAAAGLGTRAPGEEAGTEEEALAAVRLLLKLGADVNAVDKNGDTAMHGAAYKSLPRMVDLLAERGANIRLWNRKNKYGWTPLMIAEGHRPGNFKPAPATIVAIRKAMRDAGVEPPAQPTPRKKRKGYDNAKSKKKAASSR